MIKLDIKKLLKTIKLNESSISFVLGLIVVIAVSSLAFRYIKNTKSSIPTELLTGTSTQQEEETALNSYEVKTGDSLWKIAENYYGDGFKWIDIATENKLSNASQIEVGQKLTIPELGKEEVAGANTETDSIQGNTYTVQKGDSLWDIAVRSYGDGYKWVEIAKINKLTNPDLIHSGNILTIPR